MGLESEMELGLPFQDPATGRRLYPTLQLLKLKMNAQVAGNRISEVVVVKICDLDDVCRIRENSLELTDRYLNIVCCFAISIVFSGSSFIFI